MTKSLQECENDPDMLYLELERIRQRIESISDERIKDDEMIAQILNQMPNAYENKVDHIKPSKIYQNRSIPTYLFCPYMLERYLQA